MGRSYAGETLRIKEAFEYYYMLGDKRNLDKVAEKFEMSPRTVQTWSSKYNWSSRVQQRDMELSKQMTEKLNVEIVNEKAKYRTLIKALIQEFARDLKEGKVKIKNIQDLERVIKLDLTLMGESTETQDIRVTSKLTEEDREVMSELTDVIRMKMENPDDEDEGWEDIEGPEVSE